VLSPVLRRKLAKYDFYRFYGQGARKVCVRWKDAKKVWGYKMTLVRSRKFQL
jgi:hypothetical protein